MLNWFWVIQYIVNCPPVSLRLHQIAAILKISHILHNKLQQSIKLEYVELILAWISAVSSSREVSGERRLSPETSREEETAEIQAKLIHEWLDLHWYTSH